MVFKFEKNELPEDINGKLVEFRLNNEIYYIIVVYAKRKKNFDINKISEIWKEEILYESLFYYGYQSYFFKFYNESGGISFGMYIVEKNGKDFYGISVNLRPDFTPEEELIAKKILFSVRIKE